MSRTKDAHLILTIDLRPLKRAFEQVGKVVQRWANLFTPSGRLLTARRNYGGMAADAYNWPDQWQSAVCAGLLCKISPCPSDAHGLACTHSCHGGR